VPAPLLTQVPAMESLLVLLVVLLVLLLLVLLLVPLRAWAYGGAGSQAVAGWSARGRRARGTRARNQREPDRAQAARPPPARSWARPRLTRRGRRGAR